MNSLETRTTDKYLVRRRREPPKRPVHRLLVGSFLLHVVTMGVLWNVAFSSPRARSEDSKPPLVTSPIGWSLDQEITQLAEAKLQILPEEPWQLAENQFDFEPELTDEPEEPPSPPGAPRKFTEVDQVPLKMWLPTARLPESFAIHFDRPEKSKANPISPESIALTTALVEKVKPRVLTSVLIPSAPLSNQPAPKYPRSARRRQLEGVVILRATISPAGVVTATEIATSSGQRILDDAARATVRLWKFKPAIRDGKEIEDLIEIPIRFSLTD